MKQWLNGFKLAIIEEDVDRISKMLDEWQQKEVDLEVLTQLQALLQEAEKLVSSKKDKLAVNMQKLQLAKKFVTENSIQKQGLKI